VSFVGITLCVASTTSVCCPETFGYTLVICGLRGKYAVRLFLLQIVHRRRIEYGTVRENPYSIYYYYYYYLFIYLFPLSLRTEHRASTVPRPLRLLFQFLGSIRHLVGLLGGGISPAQGLYLHRTTQHRKTQANIHAPSRIRTCNPNFRAAEDSTCLRPLGH
jgi:hypothetical protein